MFQVLRTLPDPRLPVRGDELPQLLQRRAGAQRMDVQPDLKHPNGQQLEQSLCHDLPNASKDLL